MSKGKKKAPKGAGGTPGGKPPAKSQSKLKNKFSMLDEARHTERDYNGGLASRRLEKRTMAFVSAGSAFDQSIEEASRLNKSNTTATVRRPSSSHSGSSEEVILFAGRNKPSRSNEGKPDHTNAQNRSVQQYPTVDSDSVEVEPNVQQPGIPPRTFPSSRPLALSDNEVDSDLLADYIANMDSSSSSDEDVLMDEADAVRKGKQPAEPPTAKDPEDLNPVFQLIAKQIEEAKISHAKMDEDRLIKPYNITERQTLRPMGESSTLSRKQNTTEATIRVSRQITSILSQRNGDVGMYYLVVYDDLDDETAEWIESDQLVNMTSTALEFFESPMWETGDSESLDSDIQAEKDLEAMFNDDLFEDEQLRKVQDRMTDEELARRLAKQEELGIDASEVVIFDGDESGEPVEYLRKEALRYSIRSRNVLPRMDSESDFDLMDYERPSLNKKKKGKGKPSWGVDPEMEKDMLDAWENDRNKKKKRKEAREELRAQGLLGGGAKAKYSNGMAIDELKEEIRDFLSSERTTLTLPPMDKTERKLVHEIAHNFNVTSTSRGNGPNRHPTLIKKLRTRPFTDQAFDGVTDRLLRRYRLVGPRGAKGQKEKKRFTYSEGDVVGSNAPALGSENRGRAMLERMGWTTGDALGALNNPGILDPIQHVVKSTRSGLG